MDYSLYIYIYIYIYKTYKFKFSGESKGVKTIKY